MVNVGVATLAQNRYFVLRIHLTPQQNQHLYGLFKLGGCPGGRGNGCFVCVRGVCVLLCLRPQHVRASRLVSAVLVYVRTDCYLCFREFSPLFAIIIFYEKSVKHNEHQ